MKHRDVTAYKYTVVHSCMRACLICVVHCIFSLIDTHPIPHSARRTRTGERQERGLPLAFYSYQTLNIGTGEENAEVWVGSQENL